MRPVCRATSGEWVGASLKRTTALGCAILVTAASGISAIVYEAPSRTAPGTTIGGMSAADLDLAATKAVIRRVVAAGPQDLQIRVGRAALTIRSGDLGISVDEQATAKRAVDVDGRSALPFRQGAKGGPVLPVLAIDESKIRDVIDRVLTVADIQEAHGDLVYSALGFRAVGPSAGQAADPSVVRRALLEVGRQLPRPARVDVPVVVRRAHVTDADVDALAAAAQETLAGTIAVGAGPLSISVGRDELGALVTVAPPGETAPADPHGVSLGLRLQAASTLGRRIASGLSRPASLPRVLAPPAKQALTAQGSATWKPTPAVISMGRPGQAGQDVTFQDVLNSITEALQGAGGLGQRLSSLVIPRTLVPPAVTDPQVKQLNAVLGTFTTPFTCCQPRVTNIALIARAVDGTLVPAGQQFSLNGLVGRRTRAKGYVDAPYIRDGELASDIGGGVSQFATTAFNAAFFAGLHIDSHQRHSFYISRYPAGREATVDFPGIDLRFTNDTKSPVLLRAATTANSVTVSIYGRNDGRSVSTETGPRRPVRGKDFRVTVTRVLSVPGQPRRTERVTTTYNRAPPS